jgi:hypothetical protein
MQLDLSQHMCYTTKALGDERGDLRAEFATVAGSSRYPEVGEDSVASLTGGSVIYT